jgi:hypothetical protein
MEALRQNQAAESDVSNQFDDRLLLKPTYFKDGRHKGHGPKLAKNPSLAPVRLSLVLTQKS